LLDQKNCIFAKKLYICKKIVYLCFILIMPIRIVSDNEEFENENSSHEYHETVDSFLKIGEKEYNLFDGYIIGIFYENSSQFLEWTIEVQIDSEDEIFEAFNEITIPEVYTIEDLTNLEIEEKEITNSIIHENHLSVPVSEVLGITFGEYNRDYNEISCAIEAQLPNGEEYYLQAYLDFRGYYYFTKHKENVKKFIEEYLGYHIDEVEIEYELQEDGTWLCIIY